MLSQVTVRSVSDRLGTIDLPCVFLGRAIVPNGSTRRARGGVSRFFGCCSHWLWCAQAPIDWGQSIYHVSSLVEPLPPMALPDAQGAASSGFLAVAPTWLRCAQAPIDWGQSIYHGASLVEPLSLMARRGAQSAAYRGFRLLLPLGYGALSLRSIGDNRSTMCLPWKSHCPQWLYPTRKRRRLRF